METHTSTMEARQEPKRVGRSDIDAKEVNVVKLRMGVSVFR